MLRAHSKRKYNKNLILFTLFTLVWLVRSALFHSIAPFAFLYLFVAWYGLYCAHFLKFKNAFYRFSFVFAFLVRLLVGWFVGLVCFLRMRWFFGYGLLLLFIGFFLVGSFFRACGSLRFGSRSFWFSVLLYIRFSLRSGSGYAVFLFHCTAPLFPLTAHALVYTLHTTLRTPPLRFAARTPLRTLLRASKKQRSFYTPPHCTLFSHNSALLPPAHPALLRTLRLGSFPGSGELCHCLCLPLFSSPLPLFRRTAAHCTPHLRLVRFGSFSGSHSLSARASRTFASLFLFFSSVTRALKTNK